MSDQEKSYDDGLRAVSDALQRTVDSCRRAAERRMSAWLRASKTRRVEMSLYRVGAKVWAIRVLLLPFYLWRRSQGRMTGKAHIYTSVDTRSS